MKSDVQIRDAKDADVAEITGIYAYHVLHGTGSFEIDPPDAEEIARRFTDLVGRTGRPKNYLHRWLRPALELGVVDNETAGERGKAAALKLGKFQANCDDVLPTVQVLATQLNTRINWICPLTGEKCSSGLER